MIAHASDFAYKCNAMETRDEKRKLLDEIGRLMARGRFKVFGEISRQLTEQGESVHSWQVINHLNRLGPSNQKRIAASVGQHAAGVCRVVEELEAKGLLRQERDPEDRRRSLVSLTPKGLRWLEGVRPTVSDAVEAMLGHLSTEEARTLRGLLLKISPNPDEVPKPEDDNAPRAKAREAR